MNATENPPTVEELFKGMKTLNDDDLFHFQIMVVKEQQLRLQSLKVGQLGMYRPHDHTNPNGVHDFLTKIRKYIVYIANSLNGTTIQLSGRQGKAIAYFDLEKVSKVIDSLKKNTAGVVNEFLCKSKSETYKVCHFLGILWKAGLFGNITKEKIARCLFKVASLGVQQDTIKKELSPIMEDSDNVGSTRKKKDYRYRRDLTEAVKEAAEEV